MTLDYTSTYEALTLTELYKEEDLLQAEVERWAYKPRSHPSQLAIRKARLEAVKDAINKKYMERSA